MEELSLEKEKLSLEKKVGRALLSWSVHKCTPMREAAGSRGRHGALYLSSFVGAHVAQPG